jgi:uncharacterized protein
MCPRAVVVGLLLACGACGSGTVPNGPSGQPSPVRLLVLTATAGFRHDSIATARQVLASLGSSSGEFTPTFTEDLAGVTGATLANYDVLFFALTSGELAFTPDQKAAILDFVARGGGFLGAHSATDTLHTWPDYLALIGAEFRDHPWTQQAAVIVENTGHPTTAGLGDRFTIDEEFYAFRENPRPRVDVLLRLDTASVNATGDYPLAWARTHGSGRVYYNALGHFSSTWTDPRFQRQIAAAIRWAARR